jgi:hypothetical protein
VDVRDSNGKAVGKVKQGAEGEAGKEYSIMNQPSELAPHAVMRCQETLDKLDWSKPGKYTIQTRGCMARGL